MRWSGRPKEAIPRRCALRSANGERDRRSKERGGGVRGNGGLASRLTGRWLAGSGRQAGGPKPASSAARGRPSPERGAEMQGTGKITQQKTNGDEIKDHAERTRDAVVRSPALAIYVADGHFADGSAIP